MIFHHFSLFLSFFFPHSHFIYFKKNYSDNGGLLEGNISFEDKELTKDEFLRLEEEKRRQEIDSKIAYRNMFEWYIIRLKFQKNKRLMYGLLLLWLVGIVLFMVIVSMIRKTSASYHLVNAINEAFILEEWYFEDFEFPKRYGDMDNYVI